MVFDLRFNRAMGGYGGAEEIDKCLIWLALVSALASVFVSIVPGPCIVVPLEDQDGLTEAMYGNTPTEDDAPNEGDRFDVLNEGVIGP